MKVLFIPNDTPYGAEKACNALCLAIALQKDQRCMEDCVFFLADAVAAASQTESTTQGSCNVEQMLKSAIVNGEYVKLCGACCDARVIKSLPLIQGAQISNTDVSLIP